MLSLAALTLATTARCRRALVLSCSSSRSSAAAACPAVSACCLLSSSASSGVNSDDEDGDAISIAAGGSGYSLSCCSRARASSAFSRSFAFELWSATHISFSQWPAQGTVVVFNFH